MDSPASSANPGTVIAGTYRLERILGEGGMGLVYEAQHLRVPRRVAIKILRTIPDAEMLARFKLEAEVASRIGHPNIVSILDFDTMPSGIPYIVMELYEGENLASVLERGPLPVARALSILRQIAAALHAAHQAGVVHRDLKPANVFLVSREVDGTLVDEVKVLDFGVSKVRNSAIVTMPDVVLGTPRYMAPEQAQGEELSPRTDQFALAVMAYEMLSGQLPFGNGGTTEMMYKVAFEAAPSLLGVAPHLPPELAAAIERAMSKRPEQRFADLPELVVALTNKPLVDRASGRAIASISSQKTELATAAANPALSFVPTLEIPRSQVPAIAANDPTRRQELPGPTVDAPLGQTLPTASPLLRGQTLPLDAPLLPVAAPDPADPPAVPGNTRPLAESRPQVSSSKRTLGLIVALAVIAIAAVILVLQPWKTRAARVEQAAEPATDARAIAQVTVDAEPADAATAIAPDTAADAASPDAIVHDAGARSDAGAARSDAGVQPLDVGAVLDRGDAAIANQRPADAEAAARRVLAQHPDNVRALNLLVVAACSRGDQPTARQRLEQVPRGRRGDARSRCRELGVRFGRASSE